MSPKKGRENTSMDYRHEWKPIITAADRIALRQRLQAVCKPDRHGTNGRYLVRSLYFDNNEDKALREKLDGVSEQWNLKTVWGVGYKFEAEEDNA